MKVLNHITSTAIPLPINDVDTDQIIPARFLKAVNMTSYADCLFADWRVQNGHPVPDFWLNREFSGNILVTGSNFGCGSSREHAAWALKDYGIDAIIAPSFADIFRNNALNNAIIPIQLNSTQIEQTINRILENPQLKINIKLDHQRVDISDIGQFEFDIDSFKKDCILNGLDEIDYLVNLRQDIEEFEKTLL